MRRASLLTVAALGLLVSLLGGTGLFAALTDTADLGPNDVNAAPLTGSADLQLATWDGNACTAFEENLTTDYFFAAVNFGPGSSAQNTVCIRNIGSQTVDLRVVAIGISEVDDSCTGDEVLYDPDSCGGGAIGELSSVLDVLFYPEDCNNVSTGPTFGSNLSDLTVQPMAIDVDGLPSNTVACYDIVVVETADYPSADIQAAQSDSVAWTFRFSGTATP